MKELKQYFDAKEPHVEINVGDRVMNRIKKTKKRSFKTTIIVAAIVMMMVSATFTAVFVFKGADGNVLWSLNDDSSVTRTNENYKIFESLDLEDGDIVSIDLKDSKDAYATNYQKSWELNDLDQTNTRASEILGLTAENTCGDYSFKMSSWTSLSSEDLQNLNFEYFKETDKALIRKASGNESLINAVKFTYTNGEKELSIGIMPWKGTEVFVDTSGLESSQPLTINDYEGFLNTTDHQTDFTIVKDGLYYHASFPANSLSNDDLVEMFEHWIK